MRANRPSAVQETKRVHRCDDSVHVSLCVLGLKFLVAVAAVDDYVFRWQAGRRVAGSHATTRRVVRSARGRASARVCRILFFSRVVGSAGGPKKGSVQGPDHRGRAEELW